MKHCSLLQIYEPFWLPPNTGDRQRESGLHSYPSRWNTMIWDEWPRQNKGIKKKGEKVKLHFVLSYVHDEKYLFSWKEIFLFVKKNNSFHEKKSETVDNLQFNLCVTCTVSNAYLCIVQRLIALQLSIFICTGL